MSARNFFQDLFRKKSVSKILEDAQVLQEGEAHFQLDRKLTVRDLTGFGIAAIIGAGIFSTIGNAAAAGGPAISLLFVFTALACGLSALCYAEFSSLIPISGSAYTYAYATFGELFAWIIGWNLILEYMMGATTVAVAWSGYFEKLLHQFHIEPPLWLMNDPATAAEKALQAGIAAPAFSFNLPALLITWIVTAILYKGIKEAAKTNNLIVTSMISSYR
jgi:APA family basic amino acid/polyamine antiporter